jgi:hypothetical protein
VIGLLRRIDTATGRSTLEALVDLTGWQMLHSHSFIASNGLVVERG